MLLRWIPAPDKWLKVNCDGSVIQPNGLATTGGIICNSFGPRLGVFVANLGSCTITRAELCATSIGLEMAWNMGARKVHLQVDSLVTVLAIIGQSSDDSRHCHMRETGRWKSTTFSEGKTVLRTSLPIMVIASTLVPILILLVTRISKEQFRRILSGFVFPI
ncbi:Putative ribonuclease H protein At1g65750 [Linum perenne]